MIDCDSHVLEPADLWQNYLEKKYVDRAICIETEDGVEKLIIGEEVFLGGVLAELGGAYIDKSKLFTPGMRYMDGYPASPSHTFVLVDRLVSIRSSLDS